MCVYIYIYIHTYIITIPTLILIVVTMYVSPLCDDADTLMVGMKSSTASVVYPPFTDSVNSISQGGRLAELLRG